MKYLIYEGVGGGGFSGCVRPHFARLHVLQYARIINDQKPALVLHRQSTVIETFRQLHNSGEFVIPIALRPYCANPNWRGVVFCFRVREIEIAKFLGENSKKKGGWFDCEILSFDLLKMYDVTYFSFEMFYRIN